MLFTPKYINALIFMTSFFREHDIPYVLTGGSAARIYGSPREVADLDFDVFDQHIQIVADLLHQYVVSGPKVRKGRAFMNTLLELDYKGVPIDIGGSDSSKTFDKENKKYVSDPTDLSRFNEVNIGGGSIRVVPKEDLISYKSKLLRGVDVEDIKAIKKYEKN